MEPGSGGKRAVTPDESFEALGRGLSQGAVREIFRQLRAGPDSDVLLKDEETPEGAISYPDPASIYPVLRDVDVERNEREWPLRIDAIFESEVWCMSVVYDDVPVYHVTLSVKSSPDAAVWVEYSEQGDPAEFGLKLRGETVQCRFNDEGAVDEIAYNDEVLVDLTGGFDELSDDDRLVALLKERAEVVARVPVDILAILETLAVFNANVPYNPTTVAVRELLPFFGLRPLYIDATPPIETQPETPFPTDSGTLDDFTSCCERCGGTIRTGPDGSKQCEFQYPDSYLRRRRFEICMDTCFFRSF